MKRHPFYKALYAELNSWFSIYTTFSVLLLNFKANKTMILGFLLGCYLYLIRFFFSEFGLILCWIGGNTKYPSIILMRIS